MGFHWNHSTEECLVMHAFCSMGAGSGGQDRDGQGEWACSPNPSSNASLPDCAHRHDRGLSKCTTNNVANVPRSPAKKLKHKWGRARRYPSPHGVLEKKQLWGSLICFLRWSASPERSERGGTRRKKDWTLALPWNSLWAVQAEFLYTIDEWNMNHPANISRTSKPCVFHLRGA